MAADVITRFKLETTQFDSKLRDTAKALHDIASTAQNAGKDFNGFSQKSIEAARALGTVASGATNTKDKLKDLVGSYNDAVKAYDKLSDAAKKGEFGQAMAVSLEQLQVRIKQTKQELYGLNDTAKKVGDNGALKQLLGGVAGKFGMSASMFTGVGAAVAGVGAAYKAISDNISTAMGFEKSMSQLSSLTGMVGKDLDQLKEYAIELGSTSTLTASQVADAFRLIGSQQPQLLASGEALKAVTQQAITLAEAAGIDLATAAQTLSTSINQMGGDSNNATRYVNVLAAASQKGAGNIAWLGEAITKSATAAKAVGTDYEELVGNLEQLAKAGFDASTAGTALRSIIMNLEKQANNDFKPSIVGLTQAFENLGKANLDIVGYQNIAGKMFASQAMALANAAGEARNMTEAITGTSVAEEQARTNTTNLDGSLKSLASAWEGLNLHINSSNGLLKASVDWLKDVVVWADKAMMGMEKYAKRKAELNNEGSGNTRVDRQIGTLQNTSESRRASVMNQQIEKYWRYINEKEKEIQQTQNIKDVFAWETISKNNKLADLTKSRDAAKAMLSEYEQRAKALLPSGKSDAGGGKVTIPVEVETEEATKSIKELQAKIKELRKLRDDAIDSRDFEASDDYNKQIKDIEAQIKSLRGGGNIKTPKTVKTEEQLNNENIQKLTQEYISASDSRQEAIRKEIKALQDRNKAIQQMRDEAVGNIAPEGSSKELNTKLAELNKQRELLSDPIEIEIIDNQIKEVKDEIDQLNGKKVEIEIVPSSMTPFEQLKQSISIQLAEENIQVDETTLKTLMQTAIQNGIDGLDPNFASLQEKLREGMNIPDSAWEDLQTQINEKLKELGIEPIKIDFKTGNLSNGKQENPTAKAIEKFNGDFSKVTGGVSSIVSGIQQMGVEIPNEIQNVFGVLSGISSIMTGITAILTLIEIDTKTTAAASVTDALIPFARGGIVPHAANGYFVPGNNYSGDVTPIMANAGELVLNKAQQSTLASELQNNGNRIQVVGRLSGEQLFLCAENWAKRTGKGEFVTW